MRSLVVRSHSGSSKPRGFTSDAHHSMADVRYVLAHKPRIEEHQKHHRRSTRLSTFALFLACVAASLIILRSTKGIDKTYGELECERERHSVLIAPGSVPGQREQEVFHGSGACDDQAESEI